MLVRTCLAALLLLAGCAKTAPDPQASEAEIRGLVEKYAESISLADTEMGAEVWLESEDSTLVHPRGEERGWREIAHNFYSRTMGATFSQRTLTVKDVVAHMFGDSAVVLLNWEFTATRQADGVEINTKGRETQVFERMDGRWALVHVHYSGLPRTAPNEGF